MNIDEAIALAKAAKEQRAKFLLWNEHNDDLVECVNMVPALADAVLELANRQAATSWEADHQQRALERYGLAEEFPFGCDAIDAVAESLLAARRKNAELEDQASAAIATMEQTVKDRCEDNAKNIARIKELEAENARLKQRLLTAAGDDLCRLTQEEIKAYTSGEVQIPPKEEFLSSCEKFWTQTADKSGVLGGCLTLAQLIAENERLRDECARRKCVEERPLKRLDELGEHA